MKSTLELIFLLEDGKTTTLELESPRTCAGFFVCLSV